MDDSARRPPRDRDLSGLSDLLAVALGGAIGATVRHGVTEWWPAGSNAWPTLLVNVVGAALIGLLAASIVRERVRLFLGVGVLGGFTTFSAYALDAHTLLANGSVFVAVAYLGATALLACLAVGAGLAAGRRLGRGRVT